MSAAGPGRAGCCAQGPQDQRGRVRCGRGAALPGPGRSCPGAPACCLTPLSQWPVQLGRWPGGLEVRSVSAARASRCLAAPWPALPPCPGRANLAQASTPCWPPSACSPRPAAAPSRLPWARAPGAAPPAPPRRPRTAGTAGVWGGRCLPGSARDAQGLRLNDSHAEVLAKRALQLWVARQLGEAASVGPAPHRRTHPRTGPHAVSHARVPQATPGSASGRTAPSSACPAGPCASGAARSPAATPV